MSKIDREIYVNNLMESIDFDGMAKEFEVTDVDKFCDLLRDEVMVVAETNEIEHDEMKLDMEQFSKTIMNVVTQYHIEEMMEKGLIKADVDVESGKNMYSLTEKGLELKEELK